MKMLKKKRFPLGWLR